MNTPSLKAYTDKQGQRLEPAYTKQQAYLARLAEHRLAHNIPNSKMEHFR